MKMYGGRSLKPTWLYSNYEWVTGIDRYATQTKAEALRTPNLELVKKYVDGSGRVRIVGNGNLKGSQAYPRGFGEAIALLHHEHEPELRTSWATYRHTLDTVNLDKSDFSVRGERDRWADADLDGVFSLLS